MSSSTMYYKGLPEQLTAKINPLDARTYAAASGWTRVPYPNGKVAIYSHPSSDLDQLLIPLDAALSDYARRMAEVVVNLAERENRPAGEVLDDLLLPPSDVLRFRLDEVESQAGVVPLEQGIDLLAGAKKALLAAACSVVQPRTFHPRLSRAEAEQLVRACRLGQTERGSFTAVISCPLDAVVDSPRDEDILPLFPQSSEVHPGLSQPAGAPVIPGGPEPFTRRVTSFLLRSVARVALAIDSDRIDSLASPDDLDPPLSANLCDALSMMQPIGDRSRLTLSASWSRTRPLPPGAAQPSSVQLRREYFPIIGSLGRGLRPSRSPRGSRFVGLVDALSGNPDEGGRVRGDVQLLIYNQDEVMRAKVNLDADDYRMAWEAHGAGGYVSLYGTLIVGDRVHRIENVKNFEFLKNA